MRYKVTILTQRMAFGRHRANVTQGPKWLQSFWATGEDSLGAFGAACARIRARYPLHDFVFHQEATGQ